MPIYEYSCPNCQKAFEVMGPFSQASSTVLCPECGAESQRLISVFASKTGMYLGVPAKEAFRPAAPAKTRKPAAGRKPARSTRRKTTT